MYVQPPPAYTPAYGGGGGGVAVGQPVVGQPVCGQQTPASQPSYGVQTTVTTTAAAMQHFGVVQPRRRKYAHLSCCGHTTIWTLMSLGLVLVITGSVLLAVFGDPVREDRVKAYNEYVEGWKGYIAEEKFSSPEFKVRSDLMCREGRGRETYAFEFVRRVMNKLELETRNTDRLEDKASSALPLEPQHKWVKSYTWEDLDLSRRECYLNETYFARPSSSAAWESLHLTKTPFVEFRFFEEGDPSTCERKGGKLEGKNTCVYPMSIRKACVKVAAYTGRTGGAEGYKVDKFFPEVSDESESSGCYYSRRSKSFREHHFERETVFHTKDYEVDYVVRYSKDAWLGYMRVTENSGYFGNDQVGLVGFGLALVIIAPFVFVASVVMLVLSCRKIKRINKDVAGGGGVGGHRSTCFITVWG
ncbi:hypothetical protein HOP50_05g38660 [Chloropicon primus]|uniref:Uncharacterized protein n=1 Tax=Chloropicon primus TaxID=1764295 RepID=A0A5B8MP27_9CHLO|nr:hypothetical protein A3770_05p38530 [Chloropicon primus]UPR00551.1 hypothetical protein HOP50_05g38660 [Chloropicon primus]|eukprot:QDZ21335.1 hypothetical protein A3770_05p38530 [Chloropicon primus]